MFQVQEITGPRRDDWKPWGSKDGYGSRQEAAEDLLRERPEGGRSGSWSTADETARAAERDLQPGRREPEALDGWAWGELVQRREPASAF
jgi:hypothetical protein